MRITGLQNRDYNRCFTNCAKQMHVVYTVLYTENIRQKAKYILNISDSLRHSS